jgi:hypothetical protein
MATSQRGLDVSNETPVVKVYTHPHPIRPDDAIQFLSGLSALAAAMCVYLSWWWWAAIFAFGSAFGWRSWYQAKKAYEVALTEYQLANAQDWLRYFEKKGRTDPPWFHNDDDGDWYAIADEGVKNWKKTIEELEAKLKSYGRRGNGQSLQ